MNREIPGIDEPIVGHSVVPHEEWIAARKVLLAQEKELTRLSDRVNEARRALPWEKVDKNYVFDGPGGKVTLTELFGDRRQLIVHHFMFAPGWEEGCVGCSHSADHVDAARQHFEQTDLAYVAVSRAPLADLEAFRKRMGWTFRWVSSLGGSFNYDYGVSFTPEQVSSKTAGYNYGTSSYAFEELPGVSVFYKDEEGNVFHTYSTYTRGLDHLLGSHAYLDLTPKGRCEQGSAGGGWLRFHDRYENKPAPAAAACGCGAKEEAAV